MKVIVKPKKLAILKGIEEKDTIPSKASFNRLKKLNLCLPWNLKSLWYSIEVCFKPIHALTPLRKIFFSLNWFKIKIDFLSSAEKSPLSIGIFKFETIFNIL